jgi:hypothetical protein
MTTPPDLIRMTRPARIGFVATMGRKAAAALGLLAVAATVPRLATATEPAAGAAATTVTFHVATGGDDRWSGRLATPAADGSDGPFATLDRARRAVRSLKVSGTLPHPVRVELHEGTFHLTEPLRLTPDDSGSPPEMTDWNQILGPERAVVYAAAAGARPVVSGGRRITGWTKGEVAGREAWMAELPEVSAGRWTFTQLWVNGRRAQRPRLPRVAPGKTGRNASYRIVEPLGDVQHEGDITKIMFVGQDEFRFAGDDLREFHNLADVDFVALHFWIASRIPFAAIDTGAKTAKLRWKSRMRLTDDFAKQGAPYYVENVSEALDTPGQFYLDRVSGLLTYLPRPGESLDTAEVIAPVLPQIMVAEGQPDRPVEWLRFEGLTFSHSEWVPGDEARTATPQAACHVPGAVVFAHARHCSLERSAVSHVGSYGVELRGACSDVDIVGNTITDLGAGGVKVWHGAGAAESCRRVTVGDNEIADGGHREHQGVGVLVGRCSGIRVVHNHIHDLDYSGISLGWTWGYAEAGTYGNVIERNHVHDIGRGMLSDMGGIYTLGVSPGTRIRHNLFHDIVSRGYGGWGIYTDEGSSDILIESNVVYRTSSQAFNQHYGRDNVVRNNILAFGTNGQIARGRLEPHDSFAFTGNIVLADKDDELFAGNWKEPRATIDGNLYFHVVRGDAATLDFAGDDFAAWQQRGLDRHSLVADPLMKDPLHGDFQLDPRSPAIERLGFVPWDYRNVGPRTKPGPAPAPETARVRGERIIDRTTAAWQSQQIQEPCILENPKNPDRLIMFYSGVPAADRSTCFIGKAWALKSDPFVWHQDPANPVFKPAATGWDSRSQRLDCVLYLAEEDAYYIYYSATDRADAQDRIGLAICPAGKDGYSGVTPETIRRHGAEPVLAPEPAEPFCETMVSQSAVLRERDSTGQWRWYMYYSYRGRNGVLPGIRLATSRDGRSWQRHYNADDPAGKGHLFASTPDAYYEWHQVYKVGDTYVLSLEVGPERGARWRPVVAVSSHPDKGWEQLDLDAVLQTRWPGVYSDETIFHVATPAFYRFDDRWYLYAQACPLPANRNYIDGKWDLWCFECTAKLPTRQGLADLLIPGAPAGH